MTYQPKGRVAVVDTETISLRVVARDEGRPWRTMWEIGAILSGPRIDDIPFLLQVRPDMALADENALSINRFRERFVVPDGAMAALIDPSTGRVKEVLSEVTAASTVAALLTDRSVYGITPSFDAWRLELWLRHALGAGYESAWGAGTPWHHQLHDVRDIAVGYLRGQVRVLPGPRRRFLKLQMLLDRLVRRPRKGSRVTDPLRALERIGVPYSTTAVLAEFGVHLPPDRIHTALGDAQAALDLLRRL